MKTSKLILATISLFLLIVSSNSSLAAEKPLKVYVLVGQSNMQGHAQVSTFEHIGMDPKTAPILKEMQDENGEPKKCEQVWITSVGHDGTETERHGRLTADYGAAGRGPKIGPEYTFGIYMQKLVNEPILIIKTAWGGKSLHTDFRPPSAGPYVFNESQLENLRRQKKDLNKIKEDRADATGRYYRHTVSHVKKVLADIKRVYPDYDEAHGYELAGFVWFQGWNDMVDGGVYPNRSKPGGYDQYSVAMADFIRDIRKDLAAPKMPFVIGVMGAGGPIEKYDADQRRYAAIHGGFRDAMAAPASLPEFEGNVIAVRTEKYWDTELSKLVKRWGKVNSKARTLQKENGLSNEEMKKALDDLAAEVFTPEELKSLRVGKSNAEYHYLGSAKILAQIGKAFAEAVAEISH